VSALTWTGDEQRSSGVVERPFDVTVDGRVVPGILWLPNGDNGDDAHEGRRPLVLAGHGATLHKRVDHIVALAHLLAREHGFATAAIDAPGHGRRQAHPGADEVQLFGDFLTEWSRPGSTDDVVGEWRATVEAIRALDEVGDGPLAYWGLSMGTIYGLPYAASEPRVQAAVLGLMGLLGPTRDRLQADAAALACPVLFLQQWHDQLVNRADAFALFDALGSIDKRLHAHPGEHSAVPAEEMLFSVEFLARHLSPQGAAPRRTP
jgi:alpha-beta hydrolase superfamily lysophospholipase